MMTIDQLGSICVLGMVAFTMLGALASHMYELGYFKKIEFILRSNIKFTHVILAIIVIILISVYSSNVGFNPLQPNAEHYGQTGDFFGGILNPIFAFCTVVLLLKSIAEQRHSNEIFKNAEKVNANKEDMHNLTNNFVKDLRDLMNGSAIEFTRGDPLNYPRKGIFTLGTTMQKEIYANLVKACQTGNKYRIPKYFNIPQNGVKLHEEFIIVTEIFLLTRNVMKAYGEQIELSTNQLIATFFFDEATKFITEQKKTHFLSQSEYESLNNDVIRLYKTAIIRITRDNIAP